MILPHKIIVPHELFGAFRVAVDLAAGATDVDIAELSALMDSLFRCAGRGAFVAVERHPADSVLAVTAYRCRGPALTWEFSTTPMDLGFVWVLHNSLVAFYHVQHPVARFTVECLESQSSRFSLEKRASLAFPYPRRSRALSLRIDDRTGEIYNLARRVELVFARPVVDTQFAEVSQWIEDWAAVAFGGYPRTEEDLETGAGAIFDVSTDYHDAMAIDVTIESYGGDPGAFESLINLIGKVDRAFARVDQLIFE